MREYRAYETFMGQRCDDIYEAECAERQEYEDVALAVKKMCAEITCGACPFHNADTCLFKSLPERWELDFNEFHNYEMEQRFKNKYGIGYNL